MNSVMSEMDNVVQSNASASEESASAAEELSSQAAELKYVVNELVTLVGSGKNNGSQTNGASLIQQVKKGVSLNVPAGRFNGNGTNGHGKNGYGKKAARPLHHKNGNGTSKRVEAHELIPFDSDDDFSDF